MQTPGLLLKGQWLGPVKQPRQEDALQLQSVSGPLSEPRTGDATCHNCQVRQTTRPLGCVSLPWAVEGGEGVEHHCVHRLARAASEATFHTVAGPLGMETR